MDAKEKWLRFFDMGSDTNTTAHLRYEPNNGIRPWPRPDNEDERVEWSLRRCEGLYEMQTWLHDDRVPFLAPYTGTELFAEAFGCKVFYPEDNMPFALPRIRRASQVATVKRPSLDSEPLARAFRIARRLRDKFPDAPVQLPDIQSPFDIAALIWAKEDFLAATLEEPEAVDELCRMVEDVLTRFCDTWFQEFGTDYIAHYPDYFMRGGLTLSEDEAGGISPRLFERFCLPALNRLSARYGGLGIHCCANARHQWPNFAKVENLKLLNLNQPPEELTRACAFFAPVCAQMHEWCGSGAPNPAWLQNYPNEAHIALYAGASSRDDALRALDGLRELERLRRI